MSSSLTLTSGCSQRSLCRDLVSDPRSDNASTAERSSAMDKPAVSILTQHRTLPLRRRAKIQVLPRVVEPGVAKSIVSWFQFVPEQTYLLHLILTLRCFFGPSEPLELRATLRHSLPYEMGCTVPRVRPLAFLSWQRTRIRTGLSGLDDLPLQRHRLSQTLVSSDSCFETRPLLECQQVAPTNSVRFARCLFTCIDQWKSKAMRAIVVCRANHPSSFRFAMTWWCSWRESTSY